MSETLKAAANYTKIGIAFTLVVGVALLLYSIAVPIPTISNVLLVLGIITIIMAIGAYATTTIKINSGDVAGAKGPCLAWGIILIFFGGVIGGLFFIFAHSKIADYSVGPPVGIGLGPIPEAPTVPGAPGPQMANLYCKEGPEKGRNFPLFGRNIRVGRGMGNDLRLSDGTVSRKHGRIAFDGVDFYIEDIGSTHGTTVNGQRILPGDRRRLEEGTEITLGPNTYLVFSKIGPGRSEEALTQPR